LQFSNAKASKEKVDSINIKINRLVIIRHIHC